ncbi:MAG: hypothetical protein NXI19_14745 [Alphaproteobacteria bacterium]|nr:hypothetical protein [Alphaproteobacteria bacterium]
MTRPVGARLASLLVPLSALMLILRDVDLWLYPRFWAEGATVYLAAAVTGSDSASVLTAPHLGYYALLANLGGWMAASLPLERAPVATLGLSLLAQMLPILVVVTGSAEIWKTAERKAVACSILLLFGQTGELHLTIAFSQFHMTVLAALIYVEFGALAPNGLRTVREGPLLAGLALAGFSSPQACLLMPAFWLRRLRSRRPADRAASLVLTATVLVQASAVILSPGGGTADRFALPDNPADRVWEFVQAMVAYPLFGDLSSRDGWLLPAAVTFGSVIFLVIQARIAWRGPHRDWLAITWFVSLGSTLAMPDMTGGAEVYLMACALLALLLLALATDPRHPMIWRRAAAVLLAAGIVIQAALWPGRMTDFHDPEWPKWRDEVRAWRAGERDDLRIHPQGSDASLSVTLPERLRTSGP